MTIDSSAINVVVAAVAFLVGPYLKTLIDLIRMAMDLPRWAPPAIALVGGYMISIVVIVITYTMAATPIPWLLALAISLPVAITAAAQAVGMTELHDHASDAVGRRRARKAKEAA
jgi:hypothetical protein